MKAAPDSVFSQAESAIRATGARVTPSRLRVLHLLQSAPGALSHGEAEEALRQASAPGIDRVTLYRVLDWLAEAGLAHKTVDLRGVFRFAASRPEREHDKHLHFRCTGCGGVFCLAAPPPAPPALPDGFRLATLELDIRGQCPDCVGP